MCLYSKLLDFHEAVRYKEMKLVLDILRTTPDIVNEQDEEGKTALHIAMRKRHMKIFNVLLEHGAKENIKDYSGKTILEYA